MLLIGLKPHTTMPIAIETRSDGEKYTPCWLSELDDKLEYIGKSSPDTDYDSVYKIIIKPENKFCEVFDGNERFKRLMDRLKEKTTNNS